jgi:hypothetical protein
LSNLWYRQHRVRKNLSPVSGCSPVQIYSTKEDLMRSRLFQLSVVAVALCALFAFAGSAIAQELIRVGVPTKAYFPTVQTKAAL